MSIICTRGLARRNILEIPEIAGKPAMANNAVSKKIRIEGMPTDS